MEEEEKKIRHTISAEETFTLAKDVFDMRTFIKNVYSNRAIIARRINVVTLSVSAVFTVLYAVMIILMAIKNGMSLSGEITMGVLIGLCLACGLTLVILAAASSRSSAKTMARIKTVSKYFRLAVRILTVTISIAAIALTSGGYTVGNFAVKVIIIIFSVFTLIVQIIPLIFGGLGKFVRWLLSPVKVKMRFSAVALEWYGLAITGVPPKGSTKKVAKKHYEAIGNVIDTYIKPELGEKYITAIKPANLLELTENCAEADRPILEGVLKGVFAYATECGYIVFDPCRDLMFEGTVEEPKRKTMKERFMGAALSFGKKKLDKFINSSSEEDD